MAWTETYLDLSAGSNGTGTSGSPWNTWANAQTGLGTISAATRLNVRNNVTLGGAVTFNPAGTSATVPLWVRGCDSSWNPIGESQSGQPTVTCGSSNFTSQPTYAIYSGIAWTGSPSAGVVTVATGAQQRFYRCTFTNTGTNAASYAINSSISSLALFNCSLSASTTTNNYCISSSTLWAYDCIFSGGATATVRPTSAAAFLVRCIVKNIAGTGYLVSTTNQGVCDHCSFYGTANSKGIDLATSVGMNFITDCVFSGFSGTGIAITGSASAGLNAFLRNNRFYNCATRINNITESIQFGPDDGTAALGGDPFVNAGSNDFSPTSYIKAGGSPGVWQGQSFTSYPDSGAVQHADPTGGGVSRGRIVNAGGF